MKIILLKDIPKLGHRYDTKTVSDGHALNMLIPKGLAITATPDAIERIKLLKAKTEGERKIQEDLMVKNITNLENVTITISGKANDKGHLFAGLHREAIVAELNRQAKIQIDPSFIMLEHPIKEVGEHMIEVKSEGKSAKFKLIIKAQ